MPTTIKVDSIVMSAEPLSGDLTTITNGPVNFNLDVTISNTGNSSGVSKVVTAKAAGKVPGGPGLEGGDITVYRIFKLKDKPRVILSQITDPDSGGNVMITLEVIITSKIPKQSGGYGPHAKRTKRLFEMYDPPVNISLTANTTIMAQPLPNDGDTRLFFTIPFNINH